MGHFGAVVRIRGGAVDDRRHHGTSRGRVTAPRISAQTAGGQPGLFSNVRKDPNGRRADVVVYHAAPALVATLDRDEEFVEVPRVSGADHAATLLRSRSMCQDYGEYQKLESARPMSILLERLKPTARRGSKPRCHCLTHGPHDAVAARLADLVAPFASVASSDDWRPEGFAHTAEAQLGYADQFLTADRRAALTQWWLAVPRRANTPNWDLVSTCQVAGQKQGLLLVEAKAHAGELSAAGKTLTKRPSANSAQNDQRIRAAIAEANTRLGGPAQGWHLTADTHYQMSNRFAWAWKLADLGVPVVLVYLGFLNADEMGNGAFHSGDDWDRCLRDHAQGVVPAAAWNRRLEVRAGSGALVPLVPLIQTAHISLTCLEARPDDD